MPFQPGFREAERIALDTVSRPPERHMLGMIYSWLPVRSLWNGGRSWRTRSVEAMKLLIAIASVTLLGAIVGVMVVIMPPLAWIAVVGLTALLLLWAMPDLPAVPDRLVLKLFILSVVVQFATPAYYAIAVPGLPWVSFRRLAWFPTIALAGLALAASAQTRSRVISAIMDAKPITFPVIGFFLWMWLTVLTSVSRAETLSSIANSYLYWLMAFVICLQCIRDERDIQSIARILSVIAIFAGPLGFIEYYLHYHFIVYIWPESFIAELFRQNPLLMDNITRNIVRNGEFRANFIYNVSLSYGEFMAVCAPLAVFFLLHSRRWWSRLLGGLSLLMCVVGVFSSGTRGGYMSIAISVPFVIVLWLIRHVRERPNSMAGAIAGASFVGGVIGFLGLLMVSQKLRWKFTGGYEGAGSTDVRWLQWEMAMPSIMSNPITGYGHGVGGIVVGYITPGGMATVDSYLLTLVVDLGVPGLMMFFAMIIAAILMMVRVYLTDRDPEANIAVGLAGALLSFASYRIVLSQQENHFLLFLLLGLAVLQVSTSKRRSSTTVISRAAGSSISLNRRHGYVIPS